MTYFVTTISLTPDTRFTEKRWGFSTTLIVCVICVDTLSRMRWSRPADDSRLDDADDADNVRLVGSLLLLMFL